MTATTHARPRLWPLGLAVAACLFFALMFAVGGNSAHSATPHANAPFALADETVTVTAPAPSPVTIIQTVTTTFFTAATTFTEASTTRVVTSVQTNVQHVVNTRFRTQVNHVNSTAVLNVNVTNTNNVLTTKQITKPVNVTNSVIITNTAQETQTATSLQTVEITGKGTASKPLADRARLAIGAGGIAVTSAAGFGFLMLRRRGRYTS